MKWMKTKERYINLEAVEVLRIHEYSKGYILSIFCKTDDYYRLRFNKEDLETVLRYIDTFLVDNDWNLLDLSKYLEEVKE